MILLRHAIYFPLQYTQSILCLRWPLTGNGTQICPLLPRSRPCRLATVSQLAVNWWLSTKLWPPSHNWTSLTAVNPPWLLLALAGFHWLSLNTECNWSQNQSYVKTDCQLASLSWNKAPISGLRPDLHYCVTVECLSMWGALSDERTGLSFARATVSSMYNIQSVPRGMCQTSGGCSLC
jgi:hypothetical protein